MCIYRDVEKYYFEGENGVRVKIRCTIIDTTLRGALPLSPLKVEIVLRKIEDISFIWALEDWV